MRNKLAHFLKDHWDSIGMGTVPVSFQFMVVNYSVILAFKDGEGLPCLIIKTSHLNSLQNEYNNLHYINSLLPGVTPKPYLYECLSGIHILVEQYLHGKKIIHFNKVDALIQNSFRQLITFHDKVKKGRMTLDRDQLAALIVNPLQQFLRHFQSSSIEKKVQNLIDDSHELEAINFPRIPQHGDFSFVNLLFNENETRVGIIDWTDYGIIHSPCYDAFSLYLSYYFHQSLFGYFLKDNPTHHILLRGIQSYLIHFGIDPDHIRLLFPVTLVTFFNYCYPERTFALKILIPLIHFYFENADKWLIHYAMEKRVSRDTALH